MCRSVRRASRPRVEGLEDRALLANITEFPVPTMNANVNQIVTGPDGNLWFTEQGGLFLGGVANTGKIGKITTAGAISDFSLPSGSEPWGIAAADGSLWFTDFGTGQIGKITTSGVITEVPISASSSTFQPEGITLGPDGNLWFTESAGHKIGVFNPATDKMITEYSLPNPNTPSYITTGPDGNLWFSERGSTSVGMIGKITTSGKVTEYPIPGSSSVLGGGPYPNGIVKGPDNNLWFTTTGGIIFKVTTSGVFTSFNINPGGNGSAGDTLNGITVGPDNNLYFADAVAGKIGQLTTTGTVTEFAIPSTTSIGGLGGSSTYPVGITVGPDKNIWFTNPLLSGFGTGLGTNQIGVLSISAPSPNPTNPNPTNPNPTNPNPTNPNPTNPNPTNPNPTNPNPTNPNPTNPNPTNPNPTNPNPAPNPTTPPQTPGKTSAPPRIVRVGTTHSRDGTRTVVLVLNEAIRAKAAMPTIFFSLNSVVPGGVSPRISKAAYNSRAHTITLTLAKKPKVSGTMRLIVSAAGIINTHGQELDGQSNGHPGVNFVSFLSLT